MTTFRNDVLLDLFRSTIGKGCGGLKKYWSQSGSSQEEMQAMLEPILTVAIEAAIRNALVPHSDDEIAAACRDVCEKMGVQLPGIEIAKLVTQTRRAVYDDVDGADLPGSHLLSSSSRHITRRIEMVKSWSENPALKLGIDNLDGLTKGLYPGEYMVLVGGPGSMKTSLALNLVENALRRGMTTLFFSLDMDPAEIQERRMMRRLRCDSAEVHRMMRASDARLTHVLEEIDGCDRHLFELYGNEGGAYWTLDMVKNEIERKMPNVVVIDYLTMLRDYKNRESDLDCVSMAIPELKSLTQRYGIMTILLSQMSKDSRKGQAKGDIGGNSRGGGISDELAHTAIELYKDIDPDGDRGRIIATVTKCRRGPTPRSFELECIPECMYFTGYSTRVQKAGRANKPVFETMQAPESWTRGLAPAAEAR